MSIGSYKYNKTSVSLKFEEMANDDLKKGKEMGGYGLRVWLSFRYYYYFFFCTLVMLGFIME